VATADRSSARKQWVKAMRTAAATATATTTSNTATTTTAATASTLANGRKGTLLPGASIGLAMVSNTAYTYSTVTLLTCST
jgi:hypothetical protein